MKFATQGRTRLLRKKSRFLSENIFPPCMEMPSVSPQTINALPLALIIELKVAPAPRWKIELIK